MISDLLSAGQGKLATNWPTPERVPLICQHEAHVWVAHLDQPAALVEQFWFTLSDEERERADRFHFPLHRNRFVAGRGMLRLLLAEYLGCSAGEVDFIYGPGGKPALEEPGGLQFNLAHSHGAALFAFSQDALGVDLEAVRTTPERNSIARGFFAPGEYKRLEKLPEAEQQLAFLRCWTRKEAFLKTSGTGITAGLKEFEVSFETGRDPEILYGGEAACSLHHLEPSVGYVGALHICNPHPRLRCYHYQPEP